MSAVVLSVCAYKQFLKPVFLFSLWLYSLPQPPVKTTFWQSFFSFSYAWNLFQSLITKYIWRTNFQRGLNALRGLLKAENFISAFSGIKTKFSTESTIFHPVFKSYIKNKYAYLIISSWHLCSICKVKEKHSSNWMCFQSSSTYTISPYLFTWFSPFFLSFTFYLPSHFSSLLSNELSEFYFRSQVLTSIAYCSILTPFLKFIEL